MTATNSSKPAKDGTGAAFTLTVAAESSSGFTAQKAYLGNPADESLIVPAQEGTAASGVAPLSGGEGILGFLSSIFDRLGTLLPTSRGQKNMAGSLSVVEAPPENAAHNQVSVANTATLIATARPGRKSVTITKLDAVELFLGSSSGVTTANGDLLPGARGSSVIIDGGSAVYGITASGTAAVSYWESY